MRPRTLIVLAALVAALAAFVWFVERDLPSSEERARQARKVLRLDADEVTAVELAWDGRQVVLERQAPAAGPEAEGEDGATGTAVGPEGEWRLTQPLTARADAGLVRSLLSTLAGLEKQRTLTDFDRGELGLAPPRARVTLRSAAGDTVLAIGAEVPADALVVAVEGRPEAHVVADALWSDVTREPGDWRDRAIFRGERADVQSLALEAAGRRVLLARRGEEYWLESPLVDRADGERVNRLFGDVVGLRASRFLDSPQETPEAMGLEPAAGVVEVVLAGEEKPFRLELGNPTAEGSVARFARAGGQLFEIQADLMPQLERPAAEWRSLGWAGLDSWQIDAARLEDARGPIALARKGGEWTRDGATISYTPVSDLLFALTDARAERVAAPEEAADLGPALGAPILTATLTGSDGEEETLTLYAPRGDHAPARAAGRDALLLLPAATAGELEEKLAALRAAEPLPEEETELPDDIEITVEEGDD